MNTAKHLATFLFASAFIFIVQPNSLLAMTACIGQPATVTWSWDANATACGNVIGSKSECDATVNFNSGSAGGGSKSVTIPGGTPSGQFCTASITCQPGNVTKSDTLTYDATKVWNGTACEFRCSGSVPSNATAYSGDTTGLLSAAAYTYSSSNTAAKCEYSCNSGYTWDGSACVAAAASCPSGTSVTWTVGGNSCSANTTSSTNSGSNASVTDSTAPTTGAATFPCTNGTFNATPNAGATCDVATYSCTGSDPTNATMCSGDSSSLSADTAKSVVTSCTATKCEFECNAGYVKSGTSCVQCPAGYYCPGPGDGTAHQCPVATPNSPVGSTNAGQCYSGDSCGPGSGTTPQLTEPTGSSACSSGTLNSSSPADTTTSGAQAWNWSCGTVTSCTAPKYGCRTTTDSNYSLSQYGANGPNNNYGCAGTCANGNTNYPTCTSTGGDCNQQSVSWGSGCSGTINAAFNGNSNSVTNSASSYTGSATFSCSNGSFTYQSGTCTPSTGSNCSSQLITWGAGCSGTMSATNDGQQNTVNNTAVNYTGSFTANCSNGSYILQNSSCSATNVCTNGATNYPTCNSCPSNYTWNPSTSRCDPDHCTNGATNFPNCDTCPPGTTFTGTECVSGTFKPNLTAGAATPITASPGVNTRLTIPVMNTGIAAIRATSFDVYTQVADAYNGGGTITKLTSWTWNFGLYCSGWMTSLCKGVYFNGNSTLNHVEDYTFPAAGNYSMRVCADVPHNDIDETDESDNCGPWTNITVADLPTTLDLAPTCTIPSGSFACNTSAVVVHPKASVTYYIYDETDATGVPCAFCNVSTMTYTSDFNLQHIGVHQILLRDQSNQEIDRVSVDVQCEAGTVWSNFSGRCTTIPDLTAGNVTPTAANPNSATTFSATIINNGTALAWWFRSFIQYSTLPNGGGTVTDTPSSLIFTLSSGGGSQAISTSLTLSAGTYYMRACADKSWSGDTGSVDESDESNNCSQWTAVTVATMAPDLTVSPVLLRKLSSPTYTSTVPVNEPISIESSITNQGTAGTGGSFPLLYQFATGNDGSGTVTDLDWDNSQAMNAGQSYLYGQGHTFTDATIKSVRVCADKLNSADTGVIVESNESNNCSPWTNFTITGASSVPDITSSVTVSADSLYTANVRETNSGTGVTGDFYAGAVLYNENDYTNPAHTHNTKFISSISPSQNSLILFNGGGVPALYNIRTCGDNPPAGAWYATHFQGMSGFNAVNESNEDNNCAISDTFALIYSSVGIDLVTGKVRPTSAADISFNGTISVNAGDTNTYYVPVGNIGTTDTPLDFYTLFQVKTLSGGWIDISPATMVGSGLRSGRVKIVNTSYRFTTEGSYYMRACADKSSAGDTGLVAEDPGYEDNNCGPTTLITVTGNTGITPTGTLDATPLSCTIAIGDSTCPVSFHWTTTNPVGTSQVVPDLNPFDGLAGPTSAQANNSTQSLQVRRTGPSGQIFRVYNNAVDMAHVTVVADCAPGVNWAPIAKVCTSPDVVSFGVTGQRYYTSPEALTFQCYDSTHYKIIKNNDLLNPWRAKTAITGPQGVNSVISVTPDITPNPNVDDDYQVFCIKETFEKGSAVKPYNSNPPTNTLPSVDAYPKTINSGGQTVVNWSITRPRITAPLCTIKADPVCANGTCSATENTAVAVIRNILATERVDGTGTQLPTIAHAVSTVAAGQTGPNAKALGQKTMSLKYTTDFTVDCNGAKATTRIRVANSSER